MKTKWARVAGVITCGASCRSLWAVSRLGPPLMDGFPTFLRLAAPPLYSRNGKREEHPASLKNEMAGCECIGRVISYKHTRRQHPPNPANSSLSKPSIKNERLTPPPFPSISCTQTPGGSTGPDIPPRPLAPAIDWFLRALPSLCNRLPAQYHRVSALCCGDVRLSMHVEVRGGGGDHLFHACQSPIEQLNPTIAQPTSVTATYRR
ncbi:hypothetical protein NQZ68_023737 [Dissostichus eleginoides]|nr:hypothetical protein NQZ68_023737 [Dissostichus eleginoides]